MKIIISCITGVIFLICSFLATAIAATPKALTSYAELLQALHQGHDVEAIIYFDKCSIKRNSSTKQIPLGVDISGADTRLNFTIYSHYKVNTNGQQDKMAVATSLNILTEHRDFGPVNAYARLRIYEDNTVDFLTSYYHPTTYEQKASATYLCSVSNGGDQNGVVLYDKND